MKRLIENTVFSGLVTACRFATWPTRRSPFLVNATTDGVRRLPSGLVITVGSPPSMTATTELVVPRSIPMILLMRLGPWRAPTTGEYNSGARKRARTSPRFRTCILYKLSVPLSKFEPSFRSKRHPVSGYEPQRAILTVPACPTLCPAAFGAEARHHEGSHVPLMDVRSHPPRVERLRSPRLCPEPDIERADGSSELRRRPRRGRARHNG